VIGWCGRSECRGASRRARGEKFTEGTLITDEVLAQIEALNPLAPLHNPGETSAGIREMRRLFPAAPTSGVDTAFSSHAAGLRLSLWVAL